MAKEIMIYGAGKYGKIINDSLKELGLMVTCFLETDEVGVTEYNGVPIYPVNILSSRVNDNIIILLSMYNTESCRDIRLLLYKYGIRNKQIIKCGDSIYKRRNKKYCIFCDEYVDFVPYGIQHDIFYKNHIIGAGYRENCECINCKSKDRERWLYYVLKKYTSIFEEECSILHFAPEKNVSEQISLQNSISRYIKADIIFRRADYVVDITSIKFEDKSFDYIIANHILEHIEEEEKALSELKRVLKPSGTLIISFPICKDIDTFEDRTIITKEGRLEAFGQEDHVRLYGRDYKERFEKFGMKIQVFSPCDELSVDDINEHGFIPDDIILMCKLDDLCIEEK